MSILDDTERFARRIDAYIAVVGDAGRETAFRLVHALRAAGLSADIRYSTKSLKAQMKVADKMGARKVVMLGDDELNRGEVTIRDMETKEQVPVKIDRLVEYLRGEQP